MILELTLTGEKPMLQSNGRTANPIDPYTRQLKALTGKRKKTDEDYAEIMMIEARGRAWETDDGLLGVPTNAVWRCIYDAAKAHKLGEDVKRGLLADDVCEPLEVDGATTTVDDFLGLDAHVDYRVVKVGMKRTMRARPRVPVGWRTVHTMELLDDVLDLRTLSPVFERAGRLVGIGDWRPRYGTFTVGVDAR